MKKIVFLFSILFLIKLSAWAQAPANDNCSGAQTLTFGPLGTVCVTGTNQNATVDATFNTCNPAPGDPGVWYTFTAAGINNEITVTPSAGAGGAQQLSVSIFNQACGLATAVACSTSTSANGPVTASYTTTAGQQLWVLVTSNGPTGGFQLCAESTTPPGNDSCSNAAAIITVLSDTICVTGTTLGATADGSTVCNPSNTGQSVWFTFAAQAANSVVTVTPTGSTPAQNLVVSLDTIGCNSGIYLTCNASTTPGGTATVNWNFTPGTQVWVQVTTYGQPGGFEICVQSNTTTPGGSTPTNGCATPLTLCSLDPFTSPVMVTQPGINGSCGGTFDIYTPVVFTVGTTGLLNWEVFPSVWPGEWDWALWDITPLPGQAVNNCPTTGYLGEQLYCNWNTGTTQAGMGMTGPAVTPPPVSPATVPGPTGGCWNTMNFPSGEFCSGITVLAGHTYMILIDNYTNQPGLTFDMNFDGSTFTIGGPFTAVPDSCGSKTVTFTQTPPDSATFLWNFGNGQTSSVPLPPPLTYTDYGSYLVSLTTMYASGCTIVTSQEVILAEAPTTSFSVTPSVCVEEPSTIVYTGSPLTGATYLWNFDGGTPLSGTGPGPYQVEWTTPGTKIITLQISLGSCTTAVDTMLVEVRPLPTISITPANPAICSGQFISLTATGAQTYSWSPAAYFTPSTGSIVDVSPPAPDTVTVIGQAANGCFNTASVFVGVDVFQLVFFETMGNVPVAAPTIISTHENNSNFDNDQLLMTGAVAATNPNVGTQVRTTTPSTGYPNASGGNNVLLNFNSIAVPSYFFQIEDINTLGLTNLMLSFGLKKQSPASNGSQLVVEYSENGINYFPLSLGPPLPTGNGTQTPWYLIDSIQGIPATQNLRLRWRQTANNMSFQIDDITLRNPAPAPTVSPAGPITAGTCVTLTASAANQYSWSGPGIMPGSATSQFLTVCASGCYEVTVWDMNSCMKTSAATCVTITNTPTPPPVATNNSPVCLGTAVQLSAYGADPGTAYTWTGPSLPASGQTGAVISVTPTAAGSFIYTVSIATPTGPLFDTTLVVVNPAANSSFSYGGSTFCQTGTDPTPTTAAGVTGTFSGSSPNLVINPATGTIDVSASQTGTYTVTFSASGTCPSSSTQTVNVVTTPQACFSYSAPQYCQSAPDPAPTACAGSGFGVFSASSSGLIINPTTGVIDLSASAGGVYTVYNYIAPSGGCAAALDSTSVTVLENPSAPLASNTGPVCAGGNLQLSASGTYPAGTTFLWSGPGITAATATQQHPLLTGVQASASGTYTVTATLGSCSSAPASTTATVNAVPATPLASSAPVCAGNTLTITVNNPLPGAVYSWITNTGAAYPATTSSLSIPGAQLSQTGTWTVYAASNGCTSPAGTVTVNVNNGPATPQLSNTGPVCAGESLQLSANGSSPTASYNWSLPNGSAYTGTGAGTSVITIPAATIAHNGTWTVVVSEAGCSAPAQTMSVTVTPVPSAPSLASNSPVCEGQSLNLTASSTAAGATYSWVYPDGSTSTAQNPVLSPATLSISGSYTVYAIVNGCVSPASTTPVVVLPSAVAPTIFTNSPVCEGEALQLSTVLVPGASYTWTTPGGNSLIGQVVTIPGALPTDSGTYTLNTPGSSGCGSAPGTVQVVVNALPDVPAVNSNSPVCFGSTITLSTAFVAGASYTWTAPDGQSYFGQSVSIPSATAADSGTYSVQVVTAASCASAVGTGTVVVVPAVSQGNVFSSSPVCQGDSLYLFASGSWPAGAVFSWTGPNYQTSLQNPVRANAQPSYSGSYTFSVSYNGCTSTPAVLQVVVHPSPSSPQASVNAPLCEGQDLLFTATAVGGGVYSWVNPQGQHFSSLQNPVITNATPAQSGVYTLYVTNGNNCTSVTPSYLTVIVKAMPQVNAVASTPLCEGQTLLLSTPLVQNAFYSWSGPAGFASTQHNPVRTNATLSMSGTYHVWVTREGCTAEDTVHVEVVPQPSAPVPFQPGDICEGTPLTLSAAGPALGHYVWTGPVSFTGQDTVILEAGLQHQGNYQVTVSVNGCTSPIGLLQNVVVLDAPNVNAFTLTASDTLICRGDVPVTLKATGAPIYSWSAPATGGLTGNPTLSQIQASPTATTTYTLVGSNTNGCRDTAYVTIRIAEPLVAEAGPDQSGLCGQDSVSLNAVAPVLGTGVWTIASGSGGVFSDNTSAQATFRGTAGQSYSLVWTVTSAVCGSDADTVQVSLQGNVAAPTATGYEACALAEDAPQPVSLAASGSAGVYEWYADSALTGSVLSYDSVYSVSLSQTSSYWVRSVENGCAGPAVEVRAVINPLPVVDAGVDVSIEQGQSTVLYASGAASYSWSPAMGLSAANVQSPVAAPIVSTTYTVSGTDAAGCTASDEVVVSLLPALAIPNGFTPNGDGSNDVWEISALTQGYPDCRVEIFNRWGGVVYASVGYFKPWDGKLEGKELPTATYYYMIYLKPGEAPIAGSVTIIR